MVAGFPVTEINRRPRTILRVPLPDDPKPPHVKWKPVGSDHDAKDSKARWMVLRRPNHGYLKADLRGEQARFSMNFYSAAQQQWYGDATVNGNGDANGRFSCPYLPTSTDAKCP